MEAATISGTPTVSAAVTLTPKNQFNVKRIEQRSADAAPATAPATTTMLSRIVEKPNQQQCSITITNTSNNQARTIISGGGISKHNGADRNKLAQLSLVPIAQPSGNTSVLPRINHIISSGKLMKTVPSGSGYTTTMLNQPINAPLSITATGSAARRSAGTGQATNNHSLMPRTTLTPISKMNQDLISALPSNVTNSITITAKTMPPNVNSTSIISNAVAAAKAAAAQSQKSGSGADAACNSTTNIIPPGTTITKIATLGNSGAGGSRLMTSARIVQLKPSPVTAMSRSPAVQPAVASQQVTTKSGALRKTLSVAATAQPPTQLPSAAQQAQPPPPTTISILDAKVSASKTLPTQFQHLHQYMSNNPSAGGSGTPPSLLKTTHSGETKTIYMSKGRSTLPPVTTNVTMPRPNTSITVHPKKSAAATAVMSVDPMPTVDHSDHTINAEPKRFSVQIMNGVLSDPKGPIQLLLSSTDALVKPPVPELQPQAPDIGAAQSPHKTVDIPTAASTGTQIATSPPASPKSDTDSDAVRLGSPTTNRRRLVAALPQSPRTQSRSLSLMVPPIAAAPKYRRSKQQRYRNIEPSRLQMSMNSKPTDDMQETAAEEAVTATAALPIAAAESINVMVPSPEYELLECTEQIDPPSSPSSVNSERTKQQQQQKQRAQTANNAAKPSKGPTDAEMASVLTAVARDAAFATSKERPIGQIDVMSTVNWRNGTGYLPRGGICLQTNEFLLMEPVRRHHSLVSSAFERSVNNEANLKIYNYRKTMRSRPYPMRYPRQHAHLDQRLRLAQFAKQQALTPDAFDRPSTGRKDIPFNWDNYLLVSKAMAAPVALFTNAYPTASNGFEVGMKLEAVDPANNSRFCVCTVVLVIGYRVKLAFDGYGLQFAFWVNADAKEIYPPGWCKRTNRKLLAPPNAAEPFDWDSYIEATEATGAPHTFFTHLSTLSTDVANPLCTGMKLEADDPRNTGNLHVATVADVITERVLIKMDGFDERYDYWTDYRSPCLHPVNWHREFGYKLVTPPDLKVPFNWDTYLASTNAPITKPHHVRQRQPKGFVIGMKLEVVDRHNPQLIRPASVVALDEFDIKVLYEGWPEEFAFWTCDDHPDLHPVNWCARTGHPLESSPFSLQSHNSQPSGCTSFGCRGIGHANDPDALAHTKLADCPYLEQNRTRDDWQMRANRLRHVISGEQRSIDRSKRMRYSGPQPRSNRVMSRAQQERLSRSSTESITALVNCNLAPQTELRLMANVTTNGILPINTVNGESVANAVRGSRPRMQVNVPTRLPKMDGVSAAQVAALEEETSVSVTDWPLPVQKDPQQLQRFLATQHILHDYEPTLAGTYNVWRRNAGALFRLNTGNDVNPMVWSITDVAEKVALLPGCAHLAERFVQHEINGSALLNLTRADMAAMPMQLGESIKVYAWTALLREDVLTKWCRAAEH